MMADLKAVEAFENAIEVFARQAVVARGHAISAALRGDTKGIHEAIKQALHVNGMAIQAKIALQEMKNVTPS